VMCRRPELRPDRHEPLGAVVLQRRHRAGDDSTRALAAIILPSAAWATFWSGTPAATLGGACQSPDGSRRRRGRPSHRSACTRTHRPWADLGESVHIPCTSVVDQGSEPGP
jgi:hypothetical protein